MLVNRYENTLAFAKKMDAADPLRKFRDKFHLPIQKNGEPYVYLCGNSLGLQPKTTEANLLQELVDWKNLGVEGHFHAKNPWMPYHEFLTNAMAKVVGAKPIEVVVMNTLTVNLHLMMVSFYQPKGKRNKILIEADAFPSDKYAAQSQIKFHGLDPKECLIELKARAGEVCLREDDIQKVIEEQGEEIALILLGNTNYYTGQYFDMKTISKWGHDQGCMVGFDCAHGAGNMSLNLHDSGCDFAVWCNYKYINSGPGSLGGAFVHERHANNPDLPRFEGWWGHNKDTRFKMRDDFEPIPGVEAWQLSNPPILSMVAVWSSLKLFKEAGMNRLRQKAISLTGYLEYLVKSLGEDVINIVTPSDPEQRGSQLSIQVKNADKKLYDKITEEGVIADWREPDVIRVAPVPMYNSYEDVYRFYSILRKSVDGGRQTVDGFELSITYKIYYMGNFKELRVWSDSLDLATGIYKLTSKKPFSNDFGLANQIQRAAVSIASNIAEGDERGSNKEAIRFFKISKGSAAEVITQLNIAYRIGYLDKKTFDKVEDFTEKIRASLKRLIKVRKAKKENERKG